MIGIDIIDKRRIAKQWQEHDLRFAQRILHPAELALLEQKKDKIRFLASRWAAKEALGKALGTGLRNPVLMPYIHLNHQSNGAPYFEYHPDLQSYLHERKIAMIAISVSDETHYTIAYAHCVYQSALPTGEAR